MTRGLNLISLVAQTKETNILTKVLLFFGPKYAEYKSTFITSKFKNKLDVYMSETFYFNKVLR